MVRESIAGVANLPTPDPTLSGWPWTEAEVILPELQPGVRGWPRISIVTPSLNQAEFLERTIRSVLLQRYPNLEYIIIDGGSTDSSIEIINKYAPHLTHYVSEADRGYVHAINKGFELATGDIMCWLSSDDFYLPGSLWRVVDKLSGRDHCSAVVGHVMKVYADGRASQKIIGRYAGLNRLLKFWHGYQMHQPSIFWRREVFKSIGYLNEERDLIADFDYWVRIARRFSFHNVDQVLSCATHHERAKTADNCVGYHQELTRQAKSFWGSPFKPSFWFFKASMFNAMTIRPRLEPAIFRCKRHRVVDFLRRLSRPMEKADA